MFKCGDCLILTSTLFDILRDGTYRFIKEAVCWVFILSARAVDDVIAQLFRRYADIVVM